MALADVFCRWRVCKPKPSHPGSHQQPLLRQQPIQGMLERQVGLSINGHTCRIKGKEQKVWLGGQRTCPVTPENPVCSSTLTLGTAFDDIELKGDLDVHWSGRGSSQRDGQINSN